MFQKINFKKTFLFLAQVSDLRRSYVRLVAMVLPYRQEKNQMSLKKGLSNTLLQKKTSAAVLQTFFLIEFIT
jgi:hypothetical protein